MNKVLLVDDDKVLCELLDEYLREEGFQVSAVHDGQSAIDAISSGKQYDVMILDIMMPQLSGLEVLQIVRKTSELPVIMLTGRGDDVDRILGLEMGADDYLGKPCNSRELLARIKAVLRRSARPDILTAGDSSSLLHGIELDTKRMEVHICGQPIVLTNAEFCTLQLLMDSAGTVLTKEILTEKVLNRKLTAYDRSIDVHVSRIRQKMNAVSPGIDVIKSIRGVGYQMLAGSDHV